MARGQVETLSVSLVAAVLLELHRAQDIVKSLWVATGRAGKSDPTWRAVMGVLLLAQQLIAGRAEPPVSLDS